MAVKIKLKRLGKMRHPQYRIIIADARTKRDGRAIEEIGKYHPKEHPSLIEVDSERAQYWLGVGAQPTEAVAAILRVTGDWQKFRGEPGAEGTLQVAEPRADKKAIFEAAAKATADEPKATAPRKKAAKAAAPAEETAPAEAAPQAVAEETPVVTEAAAAEAPAAEAVVEETPATEAASEAAPEAAAEETPVVAEAAADDAPAEEPAKDEA